MRLSELDYDPCLLIIFVQSRYNTYLEFSTVGTVDALPTVQIRHCNVMSKKIFLVLFFVCVSFENPNPYLLEFYISSVERFIFKLRQITTSFLNRFRNVGRYINKVLTCGIFMLVLCSVEALCKRYI